MFFIVLLSSGTLVTLLNDAANQKLCAAASVIVTVLATLDLVVGFSRRAKDHEVLYKQFHDLLIDIQTTPELNLEILNHWKRRRLNIEADEPPIYRALDISCHNEEAQAQGFSRHERRDIPYFERVFMHFFRFPNKEWQRLPKGSDEVISTE